MRERRRQRQHPEVEFLGCLSTPNQMQCDVRSTILHAPSADGFGITKNRPALPSASEILSLRQNFLHDLAVNVGETEIAAEMPRGEFEVIDAELMQDCRV